ncbi:MAG TPA: hypothetical protein VE709_13530, partial [Pseudonocardiaceae bacterium]|nr:hypothetical protein [Pseudonocardiaceae bacterium]
MEREVRRVLRRPEARVVVAGLLDGYEHRLGQHGLAGVGDRLGQLRRLRCPRGEHAGAGEQA